MIRSLTLVSFFLSCGLLPSAAAQSCGAQGVAVQVLGSGGPELQDKRASSSYLVWEDGRARALVDAGGGSALRFGESGAQMSQLDVILFSHFHVDHSGDFRRSSNHLGLKIASVLCRSMVQRETTSCLPRSSL